MGASCSVHNRFPPRTGGAQGAFLRVLSVNDVYTLDILPRLATAIAQAKATAPKGCTVIAVLNGDFLSPCIYTALDGGATMAQAIHAVGFDYCCLGNHEFDIGIPQLADKLRSCSSKVLNSNVINAELDLFPKSATLAIGKRLVLFGGFVTPDRDIYSPSNMPDVLEFEGAAHAIWTAAAEAGRAPDCLIPLTHQRIEEDRDFASALTEPLKSAMPVLLGGHEHEVNI